jgi:uncharacterized tellurite resistance protein B-like protein
MATELEKRIIRPHDRRTQRVRGQQDPHALEVAALGELMLGAAFADGDKQAVEVVTIAELLKELVDIDRMPELLARRLERFDPKTFDVETACTHLSANTDEERLAVLQLVARVLGADSVLHPGEVTYLRRVAKALGIDPDQLQIEVRGPGG